MSIYGIDTSDVYAALPQYTDYNAALNSGRQAVQGVIDQQRADQLAQAQAIMRQQQIDAYQQRMDQEEQLFPGKVDRQDLENEMLGHKNDELTVGADGLTPYQRARFSMHPQRGPGSPLSLDFAQQRIALAQQREARLSAPRPGPQPVYDTLARVDRDFKAATGHSLGELAGVPPERQHLDDSGFWVGDYDADGKPQKEWSTSPDIYNFALKRREGIVNGQPQILNAPPQASSSPASPSPAPSTPSLSFGPASSFPGLHLRLPPRPNAAPAVSTAQGQPPAIDPFFSSGSGPGIFGNPFANPFAAPPNPSAAAPAQDQPQASTSTLPGPGLRFGIDSGPNTFGNPFANPFENPFSAPPASANPAPRRQAAQTPGAANDSAAILQKAREAIAGGADPQKVKDRLESWGIDSGGL